MALAEASLRQGELQIAESRYRSATFDAWMIAGGLHVAAGRLPQARDAFRHASQAVAEADAALRSLALVQMQIGELAEAVAVLTRLSARAPKDLQARRLLAQALDGERPIGRSGPDARGIARAGSRRCGDHVPAGGRVPSVEESRCGSASVCRGRRRPPDSANLGPHRPDLPRLPPVRSRPRRTEQGARAGSLCPPRALLSRHAGGPVRRRRSARGGDSRVSRRAEAGA